MAGKRNTAAIALPPYPDDVDLDELARRTEHFTGADLENLVRRAGLLALRENLKADRVPMRLFEESLRETRASVTPEMEEDYRRIARQLKQESPRTRQIGFTLSANGE